MPSDPALAAILGVVFLATLVRAVFGFGNSLVAMPLIVLFLDIRTTTPMVALIAQFMACCLLLPHWRDIELKSAWRLLLASLVGIPVGLLFLKGVHEEIVKTALAVMILGSSAWALLRPHWSGTLREAWAYPFGLVAGILGGAYNTNGPPVVIFATLRRWRPERFRATLQGYFFVTGLLVLAGHAAGGLWTERVFRLSALSVPAMIAGLLVGNRIHRNLPAERYTRLIHYFLIFVALLLLARTWL